MDARDHIKFLFDLVIRGELRLKPLSHGLDNLCMELIQNNYSRYRRLYDNLSEELNRKRVPNVESAEMEAYKINYWKALHEAKLTIDFWDNLSRLYYEGNPDATVTPRTLPDSRKCIIVGSSDGKSRQENGSNTKESKTDKLPASRSNCNTSNRLLAGSKKRRKESRKRNQRD